MLGRLAAEQELSRQVVRPLGLVDPGSAPFVKLILGAADRDLHHGAVDLIVELIGHAYDQVTVTGPEIFTDPLPVIALSKVTSTSKDSE